MPTGLFENELTVQLWRPVTIRGYTFNVGDNVTLDQTKVQRQAGEGGGFAWLYATTQAERTELAVRELLEPPAAPAAPRGEQGPDALADRVPEGSVRDPAGGPVADAAVPLRQAEKGSRPARPTSSRITSRRGTGPSSPTRRSRSGRPSYLAERVQGASELPGRRLGDDDEQGVALPPVPCDRRIQADRHRPEHRQRPRPPPGRAPVPAGLSGGVDRQSAPAGPLHGDAAEHRAARRDPDARPQDVREPADGDGPGDPGYPAQLCRCRRAPARRRGRPEDGRGTRVRVRRRRRRARRRDAAGRRPP